MTENYIKTLNISCKFFLELAKTEKISIKRKSFALSTIINSWVLLEAYINYVSEVLSKANIESHERALLLDKELKLGDKGNFIEIRSHSPTLKRALFIIRRFSSTDIEDFKKTKIWKDIQKCEEIRNDLVHPKVVTKKFLEHQISVKKAEIFRQGIVLFIQFIHQNVLRKKIVLD